MRETREKMAKEQERKLQELIEAQKTGRNSDVVLKGTRHCLLLKFLYLASDAKSVVSTSEGGSSACAC